MDLKKYLYFFFLMSFSNFAQVSINTSGGNATNGTGSVSYSVGQIFYKTVYENNTIINEGVQQPYEIVALSTEESDLQFLNISVYPNPTKDIIILDYKDFNFLDTTYQLFDFSGKLLQKGEIIRKETKLSLEMYPISTYLLIIMDDKKQTKKFKIIKN